MTVPVDRLPRVEGSGTWPPPLTAGITWVTRLNRPPPFPARLLTRTIRIETSDLWPWRPLRVDRAMGEAPALWFRNGDMVVEGANT
jgi:hypothetical protein